MAKATAATDLLKSAGKGAMEKTLQAFLPEIMNRLEGLSQQVGDLRKETAQHITELRRETTQQMGELRKENAQQMGELRKEAAQHMAGLRSEVGELREQVNTRTDRTQELINELGLRINTVGTRLDTYFEFARRDSAKMDAWLERLVRVEEAQKLRSSRAGE